MSHAIVSETPSEGSAGNPPDVADLFARLDIGHLRYRDFQIPGEVALRDGCDIPDVLQSDKDAALISGDASHPVYQNHSIESPEDVPRVVESGGRRLG